MKIQSRDRHCISRRNISSAALQVLQGLSRAGYAAYLVGGGVRDLLLGRTPKDFDISTDAHPNQIRRLFRRNCFLVGRRFRLAHIRFGETVIETSTFRRTPDPDTMPHPPEGSLYQRSDNTFGTPEQDAQRRDFTINGLFYDINSFAVIDYVDGLKDLDQRRIRSIGDPNIRFREDPVRMLRAIRFSARLDFVIDRADLRAIRRHAHEILQASPPRLFEEILRLFSFRTAETAFRLLWKSGLMAPLFPAMAAFIDRCGRDSAPSWSYLNALDQAPGPDAGPALCFCSFLHPLLLERLGETAPAGAAALFEERFHAVFDPLVDRLSLPKALVAKMRYLVKVQPDFDAVHPQRRRVSGHADFPDAVRLQRIHRMVTGADVTDLDALLARLEARPAADGTPVERSRRPRRRRRSGERRPGPPDPA